MSKINHLITPSFLRHFGHDNLSRLMHEYCSTDDSLLKADYLKDKETFNKELVLISNKLSSPQPPVNSQLIDDLIQIYELCTEDGMSAMIRACSISNQNALAQGKDNCQLALEMVLNHPELLKTSKTLIRVDNLSNWRLFKAKAPTEVLPTLQHCKNQMQQRMIACAEKYHYGSHFNIDVVKDKDRLVLDLRYPGHLVKRDCFGPEGGLESRSERKVLEASLVYWPETGILKIRTSNRSNQLREEIKAIFAETFLINPDALINDLKVRIINLEELKLRRTLEMETFNGIASAKIKHVCFLPSPTSKNPVSIQCLTADFWQWLVNHNFDPHQVELLTVDIQFYFDKATGRQRTVKLNGPANGIIMIDNDHRASLITHCLKELGVING